MPRFYSPQFSEHALTVFDDADFDKSGVLTGSELRIAVSKILPPDVSQDPLEAQARQALVPSPAPMDGTFTEADRSVLELQKTFMNMLHIDTHTEFGVPRAHMPAYAAACGIQSALMYITTAAV